MMTEEINEIESIVKSHKSGKVAFHVAHYMLMTDHGLDSDNALELLFPPLGDDDFQLQIPPDPNDIMQLKIIDVEGEEQ